MSIIVPIVITVKYSYKGYMVDALTQNDYEGRRSLRKASGRWQPTFDPEMSEWGNLSVEETRHHALNT